MKMRNAAMMLDESLTTIRGHFFNSKGEYTFLCSKVLAHNLNKDDLVAVESMRGISVVQVTQVDEESEIDLDTAFEYKFAFQKIDTLVLDALNETLDKSVQQLKSVQRSALRKQLQDHIAQGKLIEPAAPAPKPDFDVDLDDDVPF